MGFRRSPLSIDDRRGAIEEACDRAVRPYRSTLREIRHLVAQAGAGLIARGEALALVDDAAARELGEARR